MVQAESGLHFTPARLSDRQRAAVEVLDYPPPFQRDVQQGGAHGAADVRTPLAPI
jgi:hypothetical protein